VAERAGVRGGPAAVGKGRRGHHRERFCVLGQPTAFTLPGGGRSGRRPGGVNVADGVITATPWRVRAG
jgi:hypothetical protein